MIMIAEDAENLADMLDERDARIMKLEAALLRIAFDDDVTSASSFADQCPCHIAYFALGGKMVDGKRVTNRSDLECQR